MITKLAEKWINDFEESSDPRKYNRDQTDCANELMKALPKWTRITDDPDTWPEENQRVFIDTVAISAVHDWVSGDMRDDSTKYEYLEGWWRPLCGIDYPPETDDE